jgi:hypothetical protein
VCHCGTTVVPCQAEMAPSWLKRGGSHVVELVIALDGR